MIKTIKNPNGRSTKLTLASKVYQKSSQQFLKILPMLPSFRRYDLTVCSAKKFLWFRVPKVGTRSILHILNNAAIDLDAEHPYHCHYPISMYKDYFKFAFIRNPYDRLVSCWLDKVVKNNLYEFSPHKLIEMQKFKNFVNYVEKQDLEMGDTHICLQSKLIDLNEIDYIGKYENFEKDLLYVLKKININCPMVEKKNASANRQHYSTYYDEDLVKQVTKIYQRDLNIFSYDF